MADQTYAVYLMWSRYDQSTDAFAGISYQRIPELPDYNDSHDALIAADKWNRENPEAAPEGSERYVCVRDNQGRLSSYAPNIEGSDTIPF